MKGPSERLKYDLRRVWKCPICGHLERTTGCATSQLCHCQSQVAAGLRRWMTLIEDGARRLRHEVAPTSACTSTLPTESPPPQAAETVADSPPAEASPAEASPPEASPPE